MMSEPTYNGIKIGDYVRIIGGVGDRLPFVWRVDSEYMDNKPPSVYVRALYYRQSPIYNKYCHNLEKVPVPEGLSPEALKLHFAILGFKVEESE